MQISSLPYSPVKRSHDGSETTPVVAKRVLTNSFISRLHSDNIYGDGDGRTLSEIFLDTGEDLESYCEKTSIDKPLWTPKVLQDITLAAEFSSLSLRTPSAASAATICCESSSDEDNERWKRMPHVIFQIPEIVELIIRAVTANTRMPQERPGRRRTEWARNMPPYVRGNSMKDAVRDQPYIISMPTAPPEDAIDPVPILPLKSSSSWNLHACLLVNRLWHKVAYAVLQERVYFDSHELLSNYLLGSYPMQQHVRRKAELIVLHRLSALSQPELDRLLHVTVGDRLQWLELYICPRALPRAVDLLRAPDLRRLVIPGNKVVNDYYLEQVSGIFPNLETLDLRACDQVSDAGITKLAAKCALLKTINLGRHRNGHLITSVSVVALARHTQLATLGVAGCDIDDKGLWELADHRGPYMTRLSLNNCRLLTNHSLPALMEFNSFPRISVLGLRNTGITDVRSLVRYRRWKTSQGSPVLLEGCERLTILFEEEERKIKCENYARVIRALTRWVNKEE
ncbi:HDR035Wp [Eremothecium sinecaudum]|uniref:HDR035Wp n=1 Tax=Eremothecium sinecaudum TaxID=45286 RepID=A0A120K288_9SACH|nr:HDR035Wp [Eremothecium sinecaudum]AMD20778.1 HDR035Wp [Eremothecium sinecaudum]